MTNPDNSPTFVNSCLKVTSLEDESQMQKELASENTTNKTIEELIQDQDEKKEENQK